MPATSLSRPLARLLDLGLVVREVPFGSLDSKRTLYRIGEPFLRFWYRFVEPNRSRLAAGQLGAVAEAVDSAWPRFLGEAWERIARDSVARLAVAGERWRPASRWWGPSTERAPMEIDIVAEHADDPDRVLFGEAKLAATSKDAATALAELEQKAAQCPALRGRRATCALWVLRRRGRIADPRIVGADDVVGSER